MLFIEDITKQSLRSWERERRLFELEEALSGIILEDSFHQLGWHLAHSLTRLFRTNIHDNETQGNSMHDRANYRRGRFRVLGEEFRDLASGRP